MRFDNKNSSIFSLYWSIGYYVGIIINKLTYTVLIVTSVFLLRSSKIDGKFSNSIKNILDTALSPYIFVEKVVVETINLIKSNLDSLIRLKRKYENLKKDNIGLKIELLKVNAISSENSSLKKILNFISHESVENYTIKQVSIINKNSFVTTIDIDINETDKNYFHEHDIVVDSKGNFIGILANIQNKLANIMLASDFISKIPAKAIGSNISLILEGKGNDILEIKHFLGKKENIRVGDRVYTSSSNDNIFYSGIYIGDIVSINNKLYVKLSANLNSLDYVVILHRVFNSNFLE